jgi:MFS family permease
VSAVLDAPTLRHDRQAQTWLGLRALSQAGDELWLVALAWTAVHVASPATAGLVVGAGTVPRAVLLLAGGVIADRYDARRVMVVVDTLRIAVLVGVAVVAWRMGPTPALLVLAAVALGAADGMHSPASATIGRQLVRLEDLPAYSGLGQTLSRLGAMGGAAVGGVVVAFGGLAGSAAIDAVTFVGVVVFAGLVMQPRFPIERQPQLAVLTGLRQSVAHLRSDRQTRLLVIALSGLNLFVVPAETIGLSLRAQEQHWGAGAVGLGLALLGAGAALSSLAVMRFRPRDPGRASFAWLVLQGGAIAGLGIGGFAVAVASAFLIGVTAGIASALLSALFAATVDPSYLGRMSSLARLGDDVGMPLSMVLFGALAAGTSVTVALAAYGAGMALLCVVGGRAVRCNPGAGVRHPVGWPPRALSWQHKD